MAMSKSPASDLALSSREVTPEFVETLKVGEEGQTSTPSLESFLEEEAAQCRRGVTLHLFPIAATWLGKAYMTSYHELPDKHICLEEGNVISLGRSLRIADVDTEHFCGFDTDAIEPSQALIGFHHDKYIIMDTSNKRGTFVNGVRIPKLRDLKNTSTVEDTARQGHKERFKSYEKHSDNRQPQLSYVSQSQWTCHGVELKSGDVLSFGSQMSESDEEGQDPSPALLVWITSSKHVKHGSESSSSPVSPSISPSNHSLTTHMFRRRGIVSLGIDLRTVAEGWTFDMSDEEEKHDDASETSSFVLSQSSSILSTQESNYSISPSSSSKAPLSVDTSLTSQESFPSISSPAKTSFFRSKIKGFSLRRNAKRISPNAPARLRYSSTIPFSNAYDSADESTHLFPTINAKLNAPQSVDAFVRSLATSPNILTSALNKEAERREARKLRMKLGIAGLVGATIGSLISVSLLASF
ncbi:hypothetical protein BZG36_01581 [Bifiguratus adelaidae]|uniref:FHA domain-containing protein n=1 Tax=Bifiguratus adelaidae TaxID=1938954 RepID=A0A261Y3Y8_9FUNG|nr:hypothetical protein BZG36_01581 [Bifiguratus adelaidae]